MWFTSNNKTRSLVTAAQWELTEWCKSQRWFCSFNTVQWKKDVPIKGNNASALLCPGKLLLKCCFQLGTTHLPFTGLLLERTKTLTQWASSMARPGWELGISSCCHCLVPKSCPILCNPMDCSPPGSSVYGISKARISEYIAISFSRRYSRPRDRTFISCIGRWILFQWATREAQAFLVHS